MPEIKNLLEGRFARVGFSLVEGAVVTFLTEGKLEENTFDTDDNGDERLTIQVEVNGEKKLLTPNMTSMRELAEAWGTHTQSWVGKKANVTIEKKRVFGQTKDVAYYHPIVGAEKPDFDSNPLKVSQECEELIMELEMCETREEYQQKIKSLAPRINKLTGNDQKAFVREKQNIEARFE